MSVTIGYCKDNKQIFYRNNGILAAHWPKKNNDYF